MAESDAPGGGDKNISQIILGLVNGLWSRKGSLALSALKSWLGVVFSLFIVFMIIPDELKGRISGIEISANHAAIRFAAGNKQGVVLFVPAQGESADWPWVNTEFVVKKGQQLTLSASGRVHTDIYKLVSDARFDTNSAEPWVKPSGAPATNVGTPSCSPTLLASALPYGALIGAIQTNGKEQPEPFYIGDNARFIAPKSGKLLLAINDEWFRPNAKARYLHLQENSSLKNPKDLDAQELSGIYPDAQLQCYWKKHQPCSGEELVKTEREIITYRSKHFEEIIANKDFGMWYRDNVGGYVVSIESSNCDGLFARCDDADLPKVYPSGNCPLKPG